MTRLLVPLSVADVSSFAKSLRTQFAERQEAGKALPSHTEWLNLIARAAGVRNFQTLKALAQTVPAPVPEVPPATPTQAGFDLASMSATARKALMQFDAQGRLVRLPNKLSVQQLCCWTLWTHFAARRKYTEKEVNTLLNAAHTFGDPATLRRELVNMKLLGRLSDCSQYWKEPQRPDADTQAFLQAWRARVH